MDSLVTTKKKKKKTWQEKIIPTLIKDTYMYSEPQKQSNWRQGLKR